MTADGDSQDTSVCTHEHTQYFDALCLEILDPSYFSKATKSNEEVTAMRKKSADVLIKTLQHSLKDVPTMDPLEMLYQWWRCKFELQEKNVSITKEGESAHVQIIAIVEKRWSRTKFADIEMLFPEKLRRDREDDADSQVEGQSFGKNSGGGPRASTWGASASQISNQEKSVIEHSSMEQSLGATKGDSQASSACNHEHTQCRQFDDLCLEILDPSHFNKTTKCKEEVAASRNKSANVLIRVLENELQGDDRMQSLVLLYKWWKLRTELGANGVAKTEEGEKVHGQIDDIVKKHWNKEFKEIEVLCEMTLDRDRDDEADPQFRELLFGADTGTSAGISGTSASQTFNREMSEITEQLKNGSF